jgi:hypothetical protein
MNFFFDNNLSHRLAKAMHHLEREGNVVHLTDQFQPDTKDEVWLKFVGEKRMILITQDKKIKRRIAELRAFKTHKVGAFILVGGSRDIWQIILQIVKNWLKIKEFAKKTKRPFVFKIPFRGKIEQLPL